MADRFFGVSVAAFRALLSHLILIPRQKVTPRSPLRLRATVNDGEVDALGPPPLELVFQISLRFGSLREEDDARRVAVNAVNDQRRRLFARTQMVFELIEQGRLIRLRR